MKKLFFAVLIFCFLAGCNTLKDLANVQKPSVRYSGMSIQDFSFRDVNLLFDFEVTNPNSFGVSADRYEYEFFINENEFLTGIQNERLRIEDNSSSTIQVPVSLAFSEVFNTVRSVASRDSLSYKMSTEVQFDIAGLGTQRVPVSASGELPIPRIPKIELNSFDVEELSISGAEMIASLQVENPNPFGVTFENTFYNIEVNGREWLSTKLDRVINLDSAESELITIPIRLSSSQMGSVLLDMLSGATEFEYHLTGSAQVGADIEGFTGMETISFDRTGTYRID